MATMGRTAGIVLLATLAEIVAMGGCGGSRDDGDMFGDGGPTGADDMGDTGVPGDGTDGGDSGSDGTRYDVGDSADVFAGDGEGCQKVDFLFVIDNSASMRSQQDNLVDAFPKFIDTIRSDVEAQDYHILVIDSDGGDGGEKPQYYGCDGAPGWLGAGLRRGESGRGPDCGFDTPAPFMTQDQTDLEDAFSCAAMVGTAGWGLEFPMSATVAAVSDVHQAPSGCNNGFLRADAVLVVTIITDDPEVQGDDSSTVGSPQEWHDAVVAAKHGDMSALVVLGLVPNGDPLREITQRFVDFVESFGDQGVLGEVMMDDYGPFFVDAVAKIDHACDSFTPPG